MGKLNNASLPSYTMKLPVSEITVKFRPFIVREEKLLLIALQSKNINQINDSMRDIIRACTNNIIDTQKICTADSEYAFLQIRSKSVGEEVKPQITCQLCGKQSSIKIKLDEIGISTTEKEKISNIIQVTNEVSVIMRYPTIHDVDFKKGEVEIAFELAEKCIDSIIIGEEITKTNEQQKNELSDFVNNLLPDQFAKILEYFKNIPELQYNIEVKCPHCGERINVVMKTVSDFFP